MTGVLLVDKPAGWTSFDVVNYVRKMVTQAEGKKPKQVKVGHTGTLDPFATGLLVLLIGKEYTKKAGELSKLDKTYEVTMKLGETSSTGDPEGEITPYACHLDRSGEISSKAEEISRQTRNDKVDNRHPERPKRHPELDSGSRSAKHKPSKAEINTVLQRFRGEIEQVPPAYSAIKINGQRAYKLARAGKAVKIEPRKVTVNSLELTNYTYPEVKFIADVTSGTYIRSLVEDIGQALTTGAYTTALRRVRIGNSVIERAQAVTDLELDNIKHIS